MRRTPLDRRALVTGSLARTADMEVALKESGFDVMKVNSLQPLEELGQVAGSDSVDAYVQLPWDVEVGGAPVEQVRQFLTFGLLARFEAAAKVLPILRPRATVVLVAGHEPPSSTIPDDRSARRRLLSVLARAIRAEKSDAGVGVVVVGEQGTPRDIAEAALNGRLDVRARISEYAAHGEGLSFSDWQREIMALATTWGD
jgi:hypothetical protein